MRLRWRVATTIAASLLVSSVAGAQSFQLFEATIDERARGPHLEADHVS